MVIAGLAGQMVSRGADVRRPWQLEQSLRWSYSNIGVLTLNCLQIITPKGK